MYSQDTVDSLHRQGTRVRTRHGFLAALGTVAEAMGLRQQLAGGLHVPQKSIRHTPVEKVIQALIGILGGCRYMKDLNVAPEPIAVDDALARCWGIGKFAHFSSVCTTLRRFTDANVRELGDTLATLSRPWWMAEVKELVGADGQGLIVVDLDLSGQPVRGEARLYEGTAFGYLGGRLARGYKIAAAFLAGRQQRWAIGGVLKPGNVNAGACLPELINLVEARVGRPRRRLDWLRQQIEADRTHVAELEGQLKTLAGKGSGPRRKALERRIEDLKGRMDAASQRAETYERDNATCDRPLRILIRADSHFGTVAGLQLLYERGFEILVKAYNGSQCHSAFAALPESSWLSVGQKRWAAEPFAFPAGQLPPLAPLRTVALRRQDVDQRIVRSVLVTTLPAEDTPTATLVELYQQRQSIEAGFQECKGTFQFGTPRLRGYHANAAFTQLVLFAFNFLRAAWRWLRRTGPRLNQAGHRFWVRVAAHCRATVTRLSDISIVTFATRTPLEGVVLCVTTPFATHTPPTYSRET
jgi:hypothetical protein